VRLPDRRTGQRAEAEWGDQPLSLHLLSDEVEKGVPALLAVPRPH
jgi:hypothetical protein